jgi:hypothetical protein
MIWQPVNEAEPVPPGSWAIGIYSDGSRLPVTYLDNSHTPWPWKGWRAASMVAVPFGATLTHVLPFAAVLGPDDANAGCLHADVAIDDEDTVRCTSCHFIRTDTGKSWGVAGGKWFPSRAQAEFFRTHGRAPEAIERHK